MYKISVILPIFNVENLLERALDSIINQTMDLNDIEVIMVDDCSSDGSKKIMEKYSSKYPNFISLFHENNSGGCGFPRNTGLEVASGECVIFFDADDELLPENCEKLYNAIKKYDADVAFGRYERVYPHLDKVEISESPFSIDLSKYYPKDKFQNIDFSKSNQADKSNEIIYAKNLQKNYDLLKLAPSVWTKIFKREFLIKNDFQFQRYAAEDLVFVLNTFLKANGIVFLNNYAGYVYYKYDSADNESMTNNVSFKLLDEICQSYIICGKLVMNFPNEVRDFYVAPQIWNWFSLWKNSNLNSDETNQLLKKLRKLKELYNNVGLKNKLRFLYIINYIKFSSISLKD